MSTSVIGQVSEARERYATERVFRMLSTTLAIASLVLLLLNLPIGLSQAALLSWPWTVFAIGSALLPPLIIIFWRRATPRVLRAIWGTEAIGLLIAFATIPVAIGDARLPPGIGITWVAELAVIAGCAAAAVWPGRYVAVYCSLLIATIFVLAFLVNAPVPGPPLGDAVRHMFFVPFFSCLAFATRRAGALLDRTISAAIYEAATSATEDARRTARQQLEMLLHDNIIVALLAYSTAGPSKSSVDAAQRALHSIESAMSGDTLGADRTARDLAWELQALTTNMDPDAEFGYRASGIRRIPAQTATALVEATSEALRNSLRHAPADRAATRQVRVTADDHHVSVIVLDDGNGFDTSSVSPARLGIRKGIVGRMNGMAGGSASVSSRVGYGTTVSMRWTR